MNLISRATTAPPHPPPCDPAEGAAGRRQAGYTSEAEAKAALAEKRRRAREEAERQAELERLQREEAERQEAERLRQEEERARREEQEMMQLMEEAKKAEQERLQRAIEVRGITLPRVSQDKRSCVLGFIESGYSATLLYLRRGYQSGTNPALTKSRYVCPRAPLQCQHGLTRARRPQLAEQERQEEAQRREQEEQQRVQREAEEARARQEAEQARRAAAEKLEQEEAERKKRRSRVAEIMSRTRGGSTPTKVRPRGRVTADGGGGLGGTLGRG